LETRTAIHVEEAMERLMSLKKRGPVEYVPILECEGRYLAEDLVATHDVPPFNRSPYDGFAIRAEDSVHASADSPITFQIIDAIAAGEVSEKTIRKGEAIRIMTGAMLPNGADAVIMFEETDEWEENGEPYMALKRPVQKGTNISFKGEDTKQGEVLVRAGTKINPGVMALLATFGYDAVPVVKPLTIGILSTGTELLEVHEALIPGKIRNSNAYMVYAQIKQAGMVPKMFRQQSDDFHDCLTAVQKALQQVDVLITTGGVSVGDYDFLPDIYRELGANVLFNKVKMRPGSVTTVVELNGKWLFGLSGNPSACFVGFELFVRPLANYWNHSRKPFPELIEATLTKSFKSNSFTRFIRGKVDYQNGTLHAVPVGLDQSNMVAALSEVEALIVLPDGEQSYEKGEDVKVFLLNHRRGNETFL